MNLCIQFSDSGGNLGLPQVAAMDFDALERVGKNMHDHSQSGRGEPGVDSKPIRFSMVPTVKLHKRVAAL